MQFPPALPWCGSVSPHAVAPMSHHPGHGAMAIVQCVRAFHTGRVRSAPRDAMGHFLYFHCNWLLFFSDSGLHPRKLLTVCAEINPFWQVWVSVTHSGSPVQQSSAALQPCDVHVGMKNVFFSGQNSRYPQSSRFPQLSCAKPLKSIVFLLWPHAFDFLRYPVLRNRQARNSQQQTWTWRKCICPAVGRSCSGDQPHKHR